MKAGSSPPLSNECQLSAHDLDKIFGESLRASGERVVTVTTYSNQLNQIMENQFMEIYDAKVALVDMCVALKVRDGKEYLGQE